MNDYEKRNGEDAVEYLVRLIAAHLPFSLAFHMWQEFHRSAAVGAYRGPHRDAAVRAYSGPDDNDRRVVENSDGGTLQPKQRLHLCFLETAIATIEVNITRGTYYAHWQIIDAADTEVKEHPQFTRANYDANDASARLQNGKYGWRWDGRNKDSPPLFVDSPGAYRSRITVKDDTGTQIIQSDASIQVEGEPRHIFIVGRPKTDAELQTEFGRRAYNNRLLNPRGYRITRDCWIIVYRGQVNEGHVVFLGQGTIEATQTRRAPISGAIATPHGEDYEGWINLRDGARSGYWYDRVHIQQIGNARGEIPLPRVGGPPPNNPYCNDPPAIPGRPVKNGVQAHHAHTLNQGRDVWATNRLSVGCTCVKWIEGATVAHPGSVLGNVRSMNSRYGGWGQDVAVDNVRANGLIGLVFRNKQTKRPRIQDALIADDCGAPELNPPEEAPPPIGPPAPDEPLHMQETMQGGVFGGFYGEDIPTRIGEANNPGNRLRIRSHLENYARGSLYHQYHHAVVFGHVCERVPNGYRLTVWIPRKVIRIWRGNPRNLLIRGNCRISWYIERQLIDAAGPPEIFWGLYPRGRNGNFDPLRGNQPLRRNWRLPAELPSGVYVSVFRYRVELRPSEVDGGDYRANDWEPEDAATDLFSPVSPVSIAAERRVTIRRRHYLEGRSELNITRQAILSILPAL